MHVPLKEPIERVLLACNPIAGRGKGLRVAKATELFLQAQGLDCVCLDSRELAHSSKLFVHEQQAQLVVIVGGDGTLRLLLPLLLKTGVPVVMLPTGGECLFAKRFAMPTNGKTLHTYIREGSLIRHSVASAHQQPFFSMLSIGFDACVVDRIAAARVGPLSKAGYILPTLSELVNHNPPELTVEVDNRILVDQQRGFFICSNSPHYALGAQFHPKSWGFEAPLACSFLPYAGRFGFLHWSLRALIGRAASHPLARCTVGETVTVSTPTPYSVQTDGDAFGTTPVSCQSAQGSILVLTKLQ